MGLRYKKDPLQTRAKRHNKKNEVTGLEPARFAAQEPKSCASANSATPAFTKSYRNIEFFSKFTLLIITNLSLNCKSFPWRY